MPAYRDPPAEDALPAWCELDALRLTPDARARLTQVLAEKPIASEPLRVSGELSAWGMVGAFALAAWGGLAYSGLGVSNGGDAHSFVAAGLHAAAALLVVRCLLGVVHALRARGPFPAGRFLHAAGLLEIHGARIRVLPADRIEKAEVVADPPGSFDLCLVHVRVFAEGASHELVLASTPAYAKTIRIAELPERGEAIRRARAQTDVDALARLELLTRHELRAATLRAPFVGRLTARPWTVAALVALVTGSLAIGVVMPMLALPTVRARDDIFAWEGYAASYPFPWITGEADRAIATRRDARRTELLARLRPDLREAFGAALDWLDAHDRRDLLVDVLLPTPDDIAAANAVLGVITPGLSPAPITLDRTIDSSSTDSPGASAIAGALGDALGIPPDILTITSARAALGETPPEGPRVRCAVSIRVVDALTGEGTRAYAALEITFTSTFLVPDRAPVALGEPIVVAPLGQMEVFRGELGDLRTAPMDPTGIGAIDALEDSIVYQRELDAAGTECGRTLAQRMVE